MPRYPTLTGSQFGRTLTSKLIPVADSVRALVTKAGGRPYRVTMIRTRWSGGTRGVGEEMVVSEEEILPTPKVTDLTGLQTVTSPVGSDELGSVMLCEISGRYTAERLTGKESDGTPIGQDEQMFYEIEFQQPSGQPGQKRRFVPASAPFYKAFQLQWCINLEKQRGDRRRSGDLR